MILTMEHLAKSYGEKVLFGDINFSIEAGDKVGIVGVNGTGKSTLIKVIAGAVPTDDGTFASMKNIRIEYLPQNKNINPENTVLAEAFRGSQPIMQVLRDYELLLYKMQEKNEDKAVQDKMVRLSEQIDGLDGWQLENDAKAILTRLGIADFTKKAGELSGGQQKRLGLAAALIQPCDLLLLDEPTNHLDSETIGWLEEYLSKLKSAVMLVTHDRYFLDNVAKKILELDRGKSYIYTGNYSDFLEQKAARLERETSSEEKRQNFLRNELKWIRRGAQARSTKQKARIQRFETVKQQKVDLDNSEVNISLGASRLGRTIIEIKDVSYGIADRKIINDFTYTLLRHDRIGILGPNGIGKSTLLNIIAGELEPTKGSVKIGETVKIGYFRQKNPTMDETVRAIEYIKEAANYITLADGTQVSASQLMELFLFDGSLQWTPIAKLSGGEKRRLYLLRILMSSPNVLLLDEPTNDLDLQTMAVLEDFIDKFNGAIVFVSHDRFFIDRLAEKVFVYEDNGKLQQYPGGYSYYKGIIAAAADKEKIKEKKIVVPAIKKEKKTNGNRKFTYKEQREYEQIEGVIAEVESQISIIEKQMQQNVADYVKIKDLNEQKDILQDKLDTLMERWEYLEEIAESIK
ncbi:ABC-F family ATP-binding cassette domain-containing protein [Pectinatus sottacetonis]|uniref:ABC-F family ATP-binding cassette domain-containing protein n=1 Tax=Pectinatus sottacetonis TaxID=1002795 RepID=UPI0018C76628|nr:ABC-F family ATP-binding cassette domain-containing protein [Pectinatus sottacetonis]